MLWQDRMFKLVRREKSFWPDQSLWSCLRHPRQRLQEFEQVQVMPYRLWSSLVGIAVGGSGLYGASLSLVQSQWRPAKSGLWLALSAGLSWCLFIPILALLTRRRLRDCFHACLVTMAYGETVLVNGAGLNILLRLFKCRKDLSARINFGVVGISNIVMAIMLTQQLRELHIPAWKTLLLWLLCLNGSGILFFSVFQHWLQGEQK